MLSVRPDKPVDPLTIAASREIDLIARELNLPYFLAGAMARDIVLTHVFGIETGLATSDVDFGVTVGSWQQFSSIKNQLIETGRFTPDKKIEHRIHYKPHGGNPEYPVDIIPFGDIEFPPSTIAWPPDGSVIMNVIGYEEVLALYVTFEGLLLLGEELQQPPQDHGLLNKSEPHRGRQPDLLRQHRSFDSLRELLPPPLRICTTYRFGHGRPRPSRHVI